MHHSRWALVLVMLASCNAKLPLEGTVGTTKPGTSLLPVHVKSNKSVTITCMDTGMSCKPVDVGASGEADLEIDLALQTPNEAATKKVVLRAKFGPREATLELPVNAVSAVPASVAVDERGQISCVTKTCSGSIVVGIAGHLSVQTVAGTLVEMGNVKATADAQGKVEAALDVPLSPPLKDMPIRTACAAGKTPLGTATLTLTFPDKAKVSTPVPITASMLQSGFAPVLSNVTKGPVLMPWEKGTVQRSTKRAAVQASTFSCFADSASDAKVSDIAVIAVSKDVTRTDKCEYNLGDAKTLKNKGTGSAVLHLHDEDVTAYDRATGKVLGSKLFKAEKKCDPNFTIKADEAIPAQDNYAYPTPIVQWAATLR